MDRLRLGVVGVGHLGKEHARILSGLPDVALVGVADPNPSQAESVALRCGTQAVRDHRMLLETVDAAVIAAPTAHHHAIASDFLNHGIPVLVEKPLASDLSQADKLVELARRQSVILQVGHIERFNPTFEELLRRPLRPKYVTCRRFSGFSGRSADIGVVLDLMIHDLDLLLALVREPVTSVAAMGVSVLGGQEDMAQTRITFAGGCVADLTASRVHPSGLRQMQVWSAEGYAEADFTKRRLTVMQPAESLRGNRVGARHLDPATLASYKAELFSRYIQTQEIDCAGGDQLTAELCDFVGSVRGKWSPRVDGNAGLNAVALATRILDSLQHHAWEGTTTGPVGPNQLPPPAGMLFATEERRAA